MKVAIWLPIPPSVNNLHVNTAQGRRRSAHYEEWRQRAGWQIARQRPRSFSRAEHYPVSVTLHTYGGDDLDETERDGDNLFKAAIDILKTHGILIDDNLRHIRDHYQHYYPPRKPDQKARLLVEIESIESETHE